MLDSVPSAQQDIALLLSAYLLCTFFAVVKIVLFSLDRNAISAERERLRWYASRIERFDENRALFDSVVATGRIFSSVFFALVAYRLAVRLMPGRSVLLVLIVTLFSAAMSVGVLAHFVPRAFAKRYHDHFVPVCYVAYEATSWPLLPFAALMHGLHTVLLRLMRYDEKLAFLSSEEQSRMHEGQNGEEGLDEEEREMIRSIFELGETTVEQIMVPRIDIQAVEVRTGLTAVLKLVREEGHSRLPVYRDTIDSMVGMLYVKDVLGWLSQHTPEEWDLQSLVKKAHYVPTGKKVDELMADFKKKRIHIAVVVDEYGGTAGIVTMEDILEEIVGDIQDEYDDEERQIVKTGPNVYEVDPHVDLQDLGDEIGVHFDVEDAEYNTLSGLVYHEHGDVPQKDTTVEYGSVRIRVLEMDHQRIQKVEVTVESGQSPVDMQF